MVPVSYTHLDVYKRQMLKEAMEKLKGTAWEVMIRQMLEENLALVAERELSRKQKRNSRDL